MLLAASAAALLIWLCVLCLPSRPYGTSERFEPTGAAGGELSRITVLIPARNEAVTLGRTLQALARQGDDLDVVVVDDRSADATADVCRVQAAQLAQAEPGRFALRVRRLEGAELPAGWSGKLWALQQGFDAVERPYTLLLDADIELAPGVVAGLLALARERGAELVSIMATLSCDAVWERLLAPAFVFFFKLLYPFARVNDRARPTAAAAGGCVLLSTAVLREAGGFAAIRGALIDDCSLAALLKGRGNTLWLGLSHSVASVRRYPRLAPFWRMVSRTAFTQLHYSAPLLVGTVVALVVLFAAPLAGVLGFASPLAAAVSALALIAMGGAYAPIVRFYKLPLIWVFTLPIAAMLLLGMTVSSALNYWRGTRAQWKGRAYEVSNE